MVLQTFYSFAIQYKTKDFVTKHRIFIPKKALKSHLKAVLERLNFKFLFVTQTWWVTLLRQIVS